MPIASLVNSRAWLAAWSIAELLSAVAAQLIITPILLHRLDSHNFSAWVIVQSVLLAAPLLSMGTGTALLSAAANARDHSTGSAIGVGLSLLFQRTIAVTLPLISVLCVVWIGVWFSDHFPSRTLTELWILSCASLVWAAVTELDTGLSSALKADDRFVAPAGLEIAARATQVVLTFCLVPLQGSVLAAIAIAVGILIAKAGAKLALLRGARVERLCAKSRGPVQDSLAIATMTSNGRWICLGVLSGLCLNAFDRWIVGAQFGAAVLAAYAICTQIAQLPHAVAAAAAQVLTPWAAVRASSLNDPGVRRQILRVFGLATTAAAIPSCALFVSLESVLVWWISPAFSAENLNMARALTVAFAMLTLNVPAYFLSLGLGLSRIVTIINTIAAVIFATACTAFDLAMPIFVALKGICFGLTLLINAYLVLLLRGNLSTRPMV